MIYVPNAPCLSDAQCAMLRDTCTDGGTLLATHLTSVADEYGRMRSNFGLADLFGADFVDPEPVEIPDLYLKLPGGEVIPQDPQVLRFAPTGARFWRRRIDRGHRAQPGPGRSSGGRPGKGAGRSISGRAWKRSTKRRA